MRCIVAAVAAVSVAVATEPTERSQKGSQAVVEDSRVPLQTSPGPGPNGLAKLPPMGWMSWERFRCDVDCKANPSSCIGEKLYQDMATRIAEDGYLAAGYKTVSIDDCWEAPRDSSGKLSGDASRFPSGMKALGDFMHSKGVQFGIYSDMGTKTCGGYPGSKGYEAADAQTFASWGVDYLKLDGCYNDAAGYAAGYPAMGSELQKTGRDIIYSCSWPAYLGDDEATKPFDAMVAAGCNLWRNWDDIDNHPRSVISIIDHWGNYSAALQASAGPGHWHDPDMILAGDDHYDSIMTLDMARLQMSIWSIVAAPLVMSSDLRTMKPEYKAILLNRDVIDIDQDPMGKPGGRLSAFGPTEVWTRELRDGSVAVALINKGLTAETARISTSLKDIGLSCSDATVRNLWEGHNFATTGLITADVPGPGVALFKVTPTAQADIIA